MNLIIKRLTSPLLVLGLLFSFAVFGGDVFVRSDVEQGQGMLRERSDGCFVVTPLHVVHKSSTISIVGSADATYKAELTKTFANDIAVLRVLGRGIELCGGAGLRPPSDLDSLLESRSQGLLKGRDRFGNRTIMEVDISYFDDQLVLASPESSRDQIVQSMSGSILMVNDQFAGMLMMESKGRGKFYRSDYLANLVDSFFQANQCNPQCEVRLSELTLLDTFKTKKSGYMFATIEMVFALPQSWPTLPYLHVQFYDTDYGVILGAGGGLSNSPSKGALDQYLEKRGDTKVEVFFNNEIGDNAYMILELTGASPMGNSKSRGPSVKTQVRQIVVRLMEKKYIETITLPWRRTSKKLLINFKEKEANN